MDILYDIKRNATIKRNDFLSFFFSNFIDEISIIPILKRYRGRVYVRTQIVIKYQVVQRLQNRQFECTRVN